MYNSEPKLCQGRSGKVCLSILTAFAVAAECILKLGARELGRELTDIVERMKRWAGLGKVKSFVNQEQIAKEIQQSHASLTDCIAKLQVNCPSYQFLSDATDNVSF